MECSKVAERGGTVLKVWHAYLGYSLNLFSYFKNGAKVADVADKHGLKAELLSRWVEVGVAVGHLRESKGGKIKTKPKMGKYLTKESKHSVGILLEELFELHMPTLLSYREQLPNKKQEPPPDMADMVAGTSSLLEALAVPKIAAVIKTQSRICARCRLRLRRLFKTVGAHIPLDTI